MFKNSLYALLIAFLLTTGLYVGDREQRQSAHYGHFGATLAVVSLACFIPFAIAPFLKPGPRVWVYDLVLIGVGLTSCCFFACYNPSSCFLDEVRGKGALRQKQDNKTQTEKVEILRKKIYITEG